MTAATSTEPATAVLRPNWQFFRTHVLAVRRLSPTFLRLTLTCPELSGFGVAGDDQRFKLILRRDGQPFEHLLDSPSWYETYAATPADRRPYVRTYTVRAARPELGELDMDVVLHGLGDDGHAGPAARWAAQAQPGDEVVVLGPDQPGAGREWGVEWAPPAAADRLLLVGDETAVPAIAAVLESLDPAGREIVAVLEVPTAADVLDLELPAGVQVRWLARGTRPRGELLTAAVETALTDLGIAGAAGAEPEEVDPALLWEVPEPSGTDRCYAWLAGEAGLVTTLRRRLVRDLGVPRTAVAFMGYWRLGASSAS